MKVKKMKIISKIVNEIASFYLEKGAKDVKIDITENNQKNGYIIHTYGTINLSDSEFENIKKNMEIHQDIEYLEYWELIGEGETSEELTLVARLCDSIYINHENGILELILKKIL
jgi:hypothetical protein